jgi:hypothetical protein
MNTIQITKALMHTSSLFTNHQCTKTLNRIKIYVAKEQKTRSPKSMKEVDWKLWKNNKTKTQEN